MIGNNDKTVSPLSSEDEAWVQERLKEIETSIEMEGGELPEHRREAIAKSLRNRLMEQSSNGRETEPPSGQFKSGECPLDESMRDGFCEIGPVAERQKQQIRGHSENRLLGEENLRSPHPNRIVRTYVETQHGSNGGFFKAPHELFSNPRFLQLSHAEFRFYCFLLHLENRYAKGQHGLHFHCGDAESAEAVGVTDRTIRKIRKKLIDLGLVVCWSGYAPPGKGLKPCKRVFYVIEDSGERH